MLRLTRGPLNQVELTLISNQNQLQLLRQFRQRFGIGVSNHFAKLKKPTAKQNHRLFVAKVLQCVAQ